MKGKENYNKFSLSWKLVYKSNNSDIDRTIDVSAV